MSLRSGGASCSELIGDALHRGLPLLQGGVAKSRREAFEGTCPLRGCGRPAAGVVEIRSGPKPICVEHTPGAEQRGYTVDRKGRQ